LIGIRDFNGAVERHGLRGRNDSDQLHSSPVFADVNLKLFCMAARKVFRRRAAPRQRTSPYNGLVSAVHAGLYISLNQCSLSKGLENRQAGVIISRQMNPTPG
jgi:hypothetical protein